MYRLEDDTRVEGRIRVLLSRKWSPEATVTSDGEKNMKIDMGLPGS